MEGLILFFFLSLLIFSSNADNMVPEIITTSINGQHTFSLPNSETVVLAAKTTTDDPQIRYKLSVEGTDMDFKMCDPCFKGALWIPLLMITKQKISSTLPNMEGTNIPEHVQSLESRNLLVSSNVQMEWQVLPLPLNNSIVKTTTAGRDSIISLPEDEAVWIAFKSPNEDSQIDFNLKFGTINLPTCTTVGKKDWSLLRVLRHKIDYEDTICIIEKDYGLTGRKLVLSSFYPLEHQIFTVSSKPENKDNSGSGDYPGVGLTPNSGDHLDEPRKGDQQPRNRDHSQGTHRDGHTPYWPNNDGGRSSWNPKDKDNSGSGDYSGGDQQPRNRDHSQGTQRDRHNTHWPNNDGGSSSWNRKDRRRPNQGFRPNRVDLPQRTPTSSSTPRKDKTTSTTPIDDESGQKVPVIPPFTPDFDADHGTIGRTIPSDEPGQKEVTLGTKPNKEGGKGLDTTKIVLILVITLLVVIAFLLCFKLVLKRCKHSQSQGTAPDTKVIIDNYSGTVELPSSTRPNSTHESENSIYGAVSGTHSAVTRQNSSHDSENSVYGVIRP